MVKEDPGFGGVVVIERCFLTVTVDRIRENACGHVVKVNGPVTPASAAPIDQRDELVIADQDVVGLRVTVRQATKRRSVLDRGTETIEAASEPPLVVFTQKVRGFKDRFGIGPLRVPQKMLRILDVHDPVVKSGQFTTDLARNVREFVC